MGRKPRDRRPSVKAGYPSTARGRPSTQRDKFLISTSSAYIAASHVIDSSRVRRRKANRMSTSPRPRRGHGRLRAHRRVRGAGVPQQQHGRKAHEGRHRRGRPRPPRSLAGGRRRQRRQPRRPGCPATRRRSTTSSSQLRGRRLHAAGAGVHVRLLRGELGADPRQPRARGRSSTAPTSCATRSTAARPKAPRPARWCPFDLVLNPSGPANSSTSGCEAADFAGFPAGSVALVQRGTCGFNVKVLNAQAAGASAVDRDERGPARPHRPAEHDRRRDRPDDPGRLHHLRGRREPRRDARGDGHGEGRLRRRRAHDLQRDRRDPQRQRRQRRDGGGAPRQRPGRPRHQRQRLRQRGAAGDRDPDGQGQAGQHRALRLVGRRGVRAARLRALRRAS